LCVHAKWNSLKNREKDRATEMLTIVGKQNSSVKTDLTAKHNICMYGNVTVKPIIL
jgi:hypothetical protein